AQKGFPILCLLCLLWLTSSPRRVNRDSTGKLRARITLTILNKLGAIMNKSLLLAVMSLTLLQFACSSERGPSASTESKSAMTDSDLKNRVETSLKSDSE